MNSLQKKLVFIGLPLVLLVAIFVLFRGGATSDQSDFEDVDSTPMVTNVVQERYEVDPDATGKMEIPEVNLQFLADSDESIHEVASSEADENSETSPVNADNQSVIEESIPLVPARRGKHTKSRAGASLHRGAIDHAIATEVIGDEDESAVASVVFTENGPFNRGGGTFGSSDEGPIGVLAPGSGNESERFHAAPPKIRTANEDGGRMLGGRNRPLPSNISTPQPIDINPSQTMVMQQEESDRPVLAPGEEIISEETIGGPQVSTLPPAIATQVRQRLDYGTSLAKRGAFASAEEIYLQVIRVIAETKDSQLGTRQHTLDLANGLTAFEEAQDFISTDLRTRVRLDVANISQTHSTTLLHDEDCETMSTIQALQRYYEYVSEQFVMACESEPVAGEALYLLGKLYASNSQLDPAGSAMQNAKSMIMQQAALETDHNNHRASNELGVLLARYGRFHDARDMLIHSVSIQPDSVVWRNLARVHEKLGEDRLSKLAMNESKIEMEQVSTPDSPKADAAIQWVSPQQLAAIGGGGQRIVNEATQTRPTEPAVRVSEKPEEKSSEPWWKVWKR